MQEIAFNAATSSLSKDGRQGITLVANQAWDLNLSPNFLLAKPPQVVDVVFAISATARDAEKTFSFMKEVIKSIFEKYGVDSLRPAVIVFGDTVSVRMNFQDSLEQDALKRLVQGLRPNRGTPDLEKALAEAKTLFSGARPHAKKVLVIISDDQSDSKSWKIKHSSQELEEDEVDVIPVGVGNEVDIQQLKDTTPQKKNAVLANKDDDVGDLADKIVDIMRESEYFVGFYDQDSFLVSQL